MSDYYECNEGHIAIAYGSKPCPLCACFERIAELESDEERWFKETLRLRAKNHELQERIDKLQNNNLRVGKWLSAALDDPAVCEEMKEDIRKWMENY